MVVTSTAAVLVLQVVLFLFSWCIVMVGAGIFILCNERFCFAQKSQSRGKLNFLKIWLFFICHTF